MKLLRTILTFVALATVYTSCSTDEVISGNTNGKSMLTCDANNKEIVGNDFVTRSSLDYKAEGGMSFKWTAGDWLTVFAEGDDYSVQNFSIQSGGGTKNAEFSSQNFDLKVGKRYYALSKSEQMADHSNFVIASQNNVTLKYSGQEQHGNGSSAHLGKYDYMAASTVCEETNAAHFGFHHLGATLRVMMYVPSSKQSEFTNTTFSEMEIYDSENKFVQPDRIFKFSAGTTNEGYEVKWPEQVINDKERFKLVLKNKAGDAGLQPSTSENFEDGSGANTYGDLVAYIEVPPYDFTGKTIGVMLKGKYLDDDVVYSGTLDGFNVEQEKAYKLNVKMVQSPEFLVQLKVNRSWQLGNPLEDLTRSTGDPGLDDHLELPTYIHYIYCHDGKVVSPTPTGTPQYVTTISTSSTDWTITTDGSVCAYNTLLQLQKPTCTNATPGHKCTYHLYAIASTSDMSSFLNLGGSPIVQISNTTTEERIKALVYNINTSNSQETTQAFMKNLYTTAWDAAETEFQGNVEDPMQDVILYHTAAKVDLKWNSSTTLPTVGGNAFVKVNSVKNTGLSLFKPTENTYASGSYTVSTAIDEENMSNGRTVFYLPQFANSISPASSCKYNVTVGDKPAEDIIFSPAITNGYTSWLRWLKKY